MLIHWIWFATRKMHDREKMEMLQHFSDAEDVFYAEERAYTQCEGITDEAIKSLKDKDLSYARKIIRECTDKDIRILTFQDAVYPRRLKHIVDPPMVLYYKGRLPDIDDLPVIGIIGTRKASAYGLQNAKNMGYEIASCGGTVVSGMAFGIDGVAMSGALSAGGTVIGVLGCGVDIVYPLSNRALFADVLRYGCLISEFPPGTPPYKWNFPKRNRIISGISRGVLVIEAPKISGALITARQALEQGRDVFAVPGNIDVATCVGTNQLIDDGAYMARSGYEVLRMYEAEYPGLIRRAAKGVMKAYPEELRRLQNEKDQPLAKVAEDPKIPGKDNTHKNGNDKKVIDNPQEQNYSDHVKSLPQLSETEHAIVGCLGEGPCLADEIIATTGLGTGAVLAALTTLEIKGVVQRLPGKRVCLKS